MSGKRYAVLVGNGSFAEAGKDAARLPALRCPGADVAGLHDLLGQPTHGGYAVTTLIDRPHNEIRRALYDCLKQAGPQDQVMIYYSGHGKLDEQGNLYLAGSDTDPGSLDLTALAAADVQKYVGGVSRRGARRDPRLLLQRRHRTYLPPWHREGRDRRTGGPGTARAGRSRRVLPDRQHRCADRRGKGP